MIPFFDLTAHQDRLKGKKQMGIARVLDHNQHILGREVAELEEKFGAHLTWPTQWTRLSEEDRPADDLMSLHMDACISSDKGVDIYCRAVRNIVVSEKSD